GGRADHRGPEREPPADARAGHVSRGPLLPAPRDPDRDPAPARAQGRHPGARAALRRALRAPAGAQGAAARARVHGRAGPERLARQRARAPELRRACARDDARRHAVPEPTAAPPRQRAVRAPPPARDAPRGHRQGARVQRSLRCARADARQPEPRRARVGDDRAVLALPRPQVPPGRRSPKPANSPKSVDIAYPLTAKSIELPAEKSVRRFWRIARGSGSAAGAGPKRQLIALKRDSAPEPR